MNKIRTYATIAFAAVCFVAVWTSDQFIGFVWHALPGFACVAGGYCLHLSFSSSGWAAFLFAAGAIIFWSAALEFVHVRSQAKGMERGAERMADGIIKVMQEQKRP